MGGWIKIHRDITDHWIFQDAEKFKWWIDMILMASHESHKTLVNGNLISLSRGQFSVSISFLASRWNRSKEKVLNFLKLLESDHMITRNSDRKSTIITICNYESYQDAPDQCPTTEPTDVRPMSDQCPTEYKKGKKGEEINNTNSAHAREERPSWDASREQGFYNTFKGLGKALPMATKLGRTSQDILKLLDVYMAERELKDKGHKDFQEFVNLFEWHVRNKKITIPDSPKPQKRVTTNEDTHRLMREMGWQDS